MSPREHERRAQIPRGASLNRTGAVWKLHVQRQAGDRCRPSCCYASHGRRSSVVRAGERAQFQTTSMLPGRRSPISHAAAALLPRCARRKRGAALRSSYPILLPLRTRINNAKHVRALLRVGCGHGLSTNSSLPSRSYLQPIALERTRAAMAHSRQSLPFHPH